MTSAPRQKVASVCVRVAWSWSSLMMSKLCDVLSGSGLDEIVCCLVMICERIFLIDWSLSEMQENLIESLLRVAVSSSDCSLDWIEVTSLIVEVIESSAGVCAVASSGRRSVDVVSAILSVVFILISYHVVV